MKKKLLFRCLMGAPIGVTISLIITVIISLCIGHGEYYPAPHELIDACGNEITAVIVQMICSLLLGALCAGSSVIWEVEKWGTLKQTLVHFTVLCGFSLPLAYALNWLPHNLYGALGYIFGFISIYVVILSLIHI